MAPSSNECPPSLIWCVLQKRPSRKSGGCHRRSPMLFTSVECTEPSFLESSEVSSLTLLNGLKRSKRFLISSDRLVGFVFYIQVRRGTSQKQGSESSKSNVGLLVAIEGVREASPERSKADTGSQVGGRFLVDRPKQHISSAYAFCMTTMVTRCCPRKTEPRGL